jgi:hypothetical protein
LPGFSRLAIPAADTAGCITRAGMVKLRDSPDTRSIMEVVMAEIIIFGKSG